MRPTQQAQVPYVLALAAFPVGTTAVPAPAAYDFALTSISGVSTAAGEAALYLEEVGEPAAVMLYVPEVSTPTPNRPLEWAGLLILEAGSSWQVVVEGETVNAALAGYLLAPTAAALLPS